MLKWRSWSVANVAQCIALYKANVDRVIRDAQIPTQKDNWAGGVSCELTSGKRIVLGTSRVPSWIDYDPK